MCKYRSSCSVSSETAPAISEQLEIDNQYLTSGSSNETCSDQALAAMLQREFDREYNDWVMRREQVLNQNSKVQVSLECFKARSSLPVGDEESDEDVPPECNSDLIWERQLQSVTQFCS